MHKIIISVLGSKGGSTKTTTSHLFSHGLSKFIIRPMLLTTDQDRRIVNDKDRLYITRSGQTAESLKRAFVKFDAIDVSVYSAALVVDGGENRVALDSVLAQYSDIILLPFRDSDEDISVIIEDMKRLPTAYALPSAWTTNSFAMVDANKVLSEMEAEFPGRILKPLPFCRATRQIIRKEVGRIDPTVTSIAKNLVVDALGKIGIIP